MLNFSKQLTRKHEIKSPSLNQNTYTIKHLKEGGYQEGLEEDGVVGKEEEITKAKRHFAYLWATFVFLASGNIAGKQNSLPNAALRKQSNYRNHSKITEINRLAKLFSQNRFVLCKPSPTKKKKKPKPQKIKKK